MEEIYQPGDLRKVKASCPDGLARNLLCFLEAGFPSRPSRDVDAEETIDLQSSYSS